MEKDGSSRVGEVKAGKRESPGKKGARSQGKKKEEEELSRGTLAVPSCPPLRHPQERINWGDSWSSESSTTKRKREKCLHQSTLVPVGRLKGQEVKEGWDREGRWMLGPEEMKKRD